MRLGVGDKEEGRHVKCVVGLIRVAMAGAGDGNGSGRGDGNLSPCPNPSRTPVSPGSGIKAGVSSSSLIPQEQEPRLEKCQNPA